MGSFKIQWQEPTLITDEEAGSIRLDLGHIDIPDGADLARLDLVLGTVVELVNQMVEDDIIPELQGDPELDGIDVMDLPVMDGDADGPLYYLDEAEAFEDGLGDIVDEDLL